MAERITIEHWDGISDGLTEYVTQRQYDKYFTPLQYEYYDEVRGTVMYLYLDEETGLVTTNPLKFEAWIASLNGKV